jgi:hypothetical protein
MLPAGTAQRYCFGSLTSHFWHYESSIHPSPRCFGGIRWSASNVLCVTLVQLQVHLLSVFSSSEWCSPCSVVWFAKPAQCAAVRVGSGSLVVVKQSLAGVSTAHSAQMHSWALGFLVHWELCSMLSGQSQSGNTRLTTLKH